MARLLDIKCPKCSAPLAIAADAPTVTCRYCGGTSVVERGGKTVVAPAPGQGVVRVQNASSVKTIIGVLVATGVAAVATVVFVLVADTGPDQQGSVEARAPATMPAVIAPAPAAAGPTYAYGDKPMLAEVNDDGVLDIVGLINEPDGPAWIAAFDGADGRELWRTDLLSKDAADVGARRGLVLGMVLSVDTLGKAQAHDLKSGKPLWTTLLGERPSKICEGDGVIVVTTIDDARHGLDPATGKSRELPARGPCKPIYSYNNDVTPAYSIVDEWDFGHHKLPGRKSVADFTAQRALVPRGPGLRFMLGEKSKGTPVPMVVGVEGRKVVWSSVVPAIDPLATEPPSTLLAAYLDGVLVVPYLLKGPFAGARLTAFDAASGERLWDVPVLGKNEVPFGMAITPERVFISSWTNLYGMSLKTGALELKLGR